MLREGGPVVWCFGNYELDTRDQELRLHGQPVKLQNKALLALQKLLQHHGRLVTREELRQALWPADTHVNFDQNLNTIVRKLRAVLKDPAERPHYIQTLPRRGYRFLATLNTFSNSGPQSGGNPIPRVAVVPFLCCPDPANHCVTRLRNTLIAKLLYTKPARFAVVYLPVETGWRKGKSIHNWVWDDRVDYIVTGTLHMAGGHIHVSAALVRAADRTYLWTENYDREFGPRLTEQCAVVDSIAASLALRMRTAITGRAVQTANGKELNQQNCPAAINGRTLLVEVGTRPTTRP